jgi:hypothetical protein
MLIIKESPYGWADKKPGWVTLHENELKTLALLMQSLKSPELEEIETELFEGGGLNKFYRLHVENLGVAYEVLQMARLSRW